MTSLRRRRIHPLRALIRIKVSKVKIGVRVSSIGIHIRANIKVSLIETLQVEGDHDFNTRIRRVGVVGDMARGAPLIKLARQAKMVPAIKDVYFVMNMAMVPHIVLM